MIAVDQTTFAGNADVPELAGNCWSACIASIIEVPIAEVPTFAAAENWWEWTLEWLADRGYKLAWYDPEGITEGIGVGLSQLPHHYIATGKSPRGDWNHSVVHFKGELAHDPCPERTGIVGDPLEVAFIWKAAA